MAPAHPATLNLIQQQRDSAGDAAMSASVIESLARLVCTETMSRHHDHSLLITLVHTAAAAAAAAAAITATSLTAVRVIPLSL